MTEANIPTLECVDPAVGDRILELGRPALDAQLRLVLEAHLEVCAFCRQTVDLEQRLAAAVRDAAVKDTRPRPATRRTMWAGATALAAVAAAAICMFALTPRPVGPELSIRGVESTRFLRPVEGEVLTHNALEVRWTEVPGADSYELRLDEVEGSASWSASTTETRWTPPTDVDLTDGESYRLVLATVPSDLLAPGAASVRFRVGSVGQSIGHRAAHAQPIAYGLLSIALILGIYAILQRRVV